MGQLADIFAGLNANARHGDSKMEYASQSRAANTNEANYKQTMAKLDFHKFGDQRKGLDLSKIAKHDGYDYDSSTPEFAKIRAKEAYDKMGRISGLGSTMSLNLNPRQSVDYEERAGIDQWVKDTRKAHQEDINTPSSAWGVAGWRGMGRG